MTTDYINLFAGLNHHLKPHDAEILAGNVYSVRRNPPRILCWEKEIAERVMRTFEMSPALFQSHDVRFVRHARTEVRPAFATHAIVDVNYLWASEYFHFFTEVLPNVLLLGESAPIYCPQSPFTLPLLRWFGVQAPLVPYRHPLATRIQAPYVECGNPSPEKIQALRRRVWDRVKFEKTHGILIHRRNVRSLLNEAEVLETLRTTYPHLTWVVFDIPSIEETAELFSKAAIIVGPHGAGMTNMIFSPPATPIVEFMPLEQPNVCYWHLSEMLGHIYHMIPVPSEAGYCMRVDCNALKNHLENLVG